MGGAVVGEAKVIGCYGRSCSGRGYQIKDHEAIKPKIKRSFCTELKMIF